MSDNRGHGNHHVISFKTYLTTGAALLVLTAVTVGVSFIDLGGFNAIVAVGIASVKALLVALIFMHLLYDKKVFLIIFSTAIVFLGLFLALTMFDIVTRGDIYPDIGRQIEKKAPMYEKIESVPGHDSGDDSTSKDH